MCIRDSVSGGDKSRSHQLLCRQCRSVGSSANTKHCDYFHEFDAYDTGAHLQLPGIGQHLFGLHLGISCDSDVYGKFDARLCVLDLSGLRTHGEYPDRI